jgi:hypothetical protein
MENSPPGIQTIPSGAGPGGLALFGTVGEKAESGRAVESLVSAARTGENALEKATARAAESRTAAPRIGLAVVFMV